VEKPYQSPEIPAAARPGAPAEPTRPLTGKRVRQLRAQGHNLQPLVTLGKEGATPSVVASVDENLVAHELIKVRVGQGCLADRKEVASELARLTGAAVAQVLGRTILLYRENKEGAGRKKR
jgi:RNA-binding protein